MAKIALMPSQIELYQQMSALSADMVAAAQTQDWDRLVELERAVSALRDKLMTDDGGNLDENERTAKAALIQRILDDDAEIRRHTEPWMEHVRKFLGDGARQRQIEKAYGAGGF